MNTFDLITVFLSELMATGFLVFFCCMGCIKSDIFPNNHLQTTLTVGLLIMILIQSFVCVSGAHMNPAITVAAVIYNIVTPEVGGLYILAQVIGGCLGYGLLKALVPSNVVDIPGAEHNLCVTFVSDEINLIQAVGIEFMLTMALILVCCSIWDPRNAKYHDSLSLKFGFTIAALACTGGAFTGASMNPARSFGPALWNIDFKDHWIYWVGPLTAGALTAIFFKNVFRREVNENKE